MVPRAASGGRMRVRADGRCRLKLYLRTPEDFGFATAVGSYGFFALAPNRWEPAALTLTTVVPAGGGALEVRVKPARRQGREAVSIEVPGRKALPTRQHRAVEAAVTRMLRLDESLAEFHARCAGDGDLRRVADLRFGRLLRSATLFEDVIKTMCTCNITWKQTLSVVARLVEHFGDPAANNAEVWGFPTPARLAGARESELKKRCGVGYRAEWIIAFARQIVDGEFDLAKCEDSGVSTEELYRHLRTIRGVGDYAASGLCSLLGRYELLAFDTVLMDHYRRRFPRRKATPANIKRHYARYHPYEYLVYWWELRSRYVEDSGQPTSWAEA
jgi:3-methyladenine DNA glycosylase/8-oxoguanine DNA glycosylase